MSDMAAVNAALLGESLILDLQELLKFLVAQMRAKGHEGGSATLEISNEGAAVLRLRVRNDTQPFVSRWGGKYNSELIKARAFGEALTQARAVIAAMDEHPTRAMAAWFDLDQQSGAPHPLVPALDGGDGSSSLSVAATSSPEPAVIDFPKRAS